MELQILLGQVFQAVREANNCLHQYRVVVDRMARLAEVENRNLEKSFWGKETANGDGSGMMLKIKVELRWQFRNCCR